MNEYKSLQIDRTAKEINPKTEIGSGRVEEFLGASTNSIAGVLHNKGLFLGIYNPSYYSCYIYNSIWVHEEKLLVEV